MICERLLLLHTLFVKNDILERTKKNGIEVEVRGKDYKQKKHD